MPASPLLVHPAKPDAQGQIHHVTPESANWTYVGFDVFDLGDGQKLTQDTGDREACIVIQSGRAAVTGDGADFGTIGERTSVFEGLPWSVYVPPHSSWTVTAEGACEIAVCTAPAKGGLQARLIGPEDVGEETRGKGSNIRHVRNILPDSSPFAESLLVVEVITPAGNWSSYPPHKHDQDNLPHESLLEETYYHRLDPKQGYGMQRVYTDDRSLDETMSFADRDVVLVPRGYHPCGAPHGYTLFYLNVMAGPTKIWKFHNDPDHAWLMGR